MPAKRTKEVGRRKTMPSRWWPMSLPREKRLRQGFYAHYTVAASARSVRYAICGTDSEFLFPVMGHAETSKRRCSCILQVSADKRGTMSERHQVNSEGNTCVGSPPARPKGDVCLLSLQLSRGSRILPHVWNRCPRTRRGRPRSTSGGRQKQDGPPACAFGFPETRHAATVICRRVFADRRGYAALSPLPQRPGCDCSSAGDCGNHAPRSGSTGGGCS